MRLTMVFGAVAALLLPVPALADAVLEKDLSVFLDWFAGRFDNEQQVFWAEDLGVPPEARHEQVHSVFRPVDLPAFGKNVFYVEQYSDGDPKKIYRQRIYSFDLDIAEAAIRLRIFTPNAPEPLAGAWREPARLKALKPADAVNLPGCDVFWKRRANQFTGYMKPGACRVNSARLGKEIVITDDLLLTENEIWIADRAETVDGEYVFGNKAGIAHKLRKIRAFECWTAVLRGARHGDSGEGMNDWQFQRGGWIHDQGGDLTLITDEAEPREVRLKLRRVEWPSGPNRPSLTLYAHEGDDARAISYAWTEADAERIGINLRWLQASCTAAPQRLFE